MRTITSVAAALVVAALIPACNSADTGTPATAPPAATAPAPTVMDRLAATPSSAPVSLPPDLIQTAPAPVAESTSLQATPEGAAPGALERVQSEQPDLARYLPPVTDEVQHVRIGWYVDRAIDAFRVAIDRNVPLVLVVTAPWCGYCQNMAINSLRCPAVNGFAGDVVFAHAFPDKDLGAKAIASSLNIEAYPTITVLEPEARMLLERGRINGYFNGTDLGQHLDTIVRKTPPRRYEDQPRQGPGRQGSIGGASQADVPLRAVRVEPQGSALETWGNPGSASAVILEWNRRGFKHVPPEPRCQ